MGWSGQRLRPSASATCSVGPMASRRNDFGASVVDKHPSRFGLLALIPLTDPAAAVEEIGRALDELHADGFILVTNYDGRYFGDPSFDPVFAELDRRGASVFVHPVNPAGFHLTSCGRPGPLIEYPMDTTRTVVDALWDAGSRKKFTHLAFTCSLEAQARNCH